MPERYISQALRNSPRIPATRGSLTGVEAAIHERIWSAILDRKLRPGAKLHEDMIGNAFGVSRTIVRKVFLIMEQEGIISLPLNRGAYVATPAPDEIRPIIETATLIMPGIIRHVVETMDDEKRAMLEGHFEIDENLDSAQKARLIRRLTQEHFILLADMQGNPIISCLMERITARCTMAMTLYQDPLASWRPGEANREANQAILDGDAEKAINIVLQHLHQVETTMLYEKPENAFDLGAILGPGESQIYSKARRSGKTRSRNVKMANGVGKAEKRASMN